ncbi:MAG: phosphotransferase [Bacteriovorax sp.]
MRLDFNNLISELKDPSKRIADFEGVLLLIASSSNLISEKRKLIKAVENIAFSRGIDLPSIEAFFALNGASIGDVESESRDSLNTISDDPEIEKYEVLDISMVDKSTTGDDSFTDQQPVSKANFRKTIAELFSGAGRDWIANYKRYYLFKIENNLDASIKAVLVYDNIPSPEFVQRALDGFTENIPLEKFIEKLEDTNSDLWLRPHLCLLILSDFSRNAHSLIERFDILKRFDNFKFYEIMFNEDDVKTYEHEGDVLLSSLMSDVHISLSNASLSRAEEALIKSFFPSEPSLIQYKLLKGGFSGSKVVEVSQSFSVPRPCKFIIKIGSKADKKITIEEAAVKKWVSSLVSSYQTEKKENATHEALKYQFASIDGKRSSQSFTEYFQSNRTGHIREIVDKLFTHELFKEWEDTQFRKEEKILIKNLYKDFLSLDKIFEEIRKIGFEKAADDIKKFTEVLNLELPRYVQKVNHGDLHSENVIIDSEKVFLIDFGMTTIAPCFIDYATLEASIRFKLTPYYFPTKVLAEADNYFISQFDVTDVSLQDKISNNDLRKSYEVISKIRLMAINNVKANKKTYASVDELEFNYLISLFCLSLRNVRYKDMNQKYSLSLCRSLSVILLAKKDTFS